MPQIVIDFSSFYTFLNEPSYIQFYKIFIYGGWIPFVYFFGWASWRLWVTSRQLKWLSAVQYVILSIKVPKETEQSPKAVEHFFSHLSGAYSSFVLKEKYWEGKVQGDIALELVSDGGNVQYLIRAPIKYRDLIEAALFAQYPDAEIAEVTDYVPNVPQTFPNETHDMWGTEFVLGKPSAYPIRTYPQFEHSLSQEFKDPLASLLEAMAKIKPGEKIWLQIMIVGTDSGWKDEGEKIVNKLLGKKEVRKPALIEKIIEFPIHVVLFILDAFLSSEEEKAEKKQEEMPFKMLAMSPGERAVVESIQIKLTKIGFKTKFRFIYVAPKPVFQKGPRIAIIKGAIAQFNALNLNGFKNYGKVSPKSDYFWQRWAAPKKQTSLMRAYRGRSAWRGAPQYILNTEELATIYHFPQIIVKAPLIKKTEAKRGEPPFGLPVEQPKIKAELPPAEEFPYEDIPSNLPVMEP